MKDYLIKTGLQLIFITVSTETYFQELPLQLSILLSKDSTSGNESTISKPLNNDSSFYHIAMAI